MLRVAWILGMLTGLTAACGGSGATSSTVGQSNGGAGGAVAGHGGQAQLGGAAGKPTAGGASGMGGSGGASGMAGAGGEPVRADGPPQWLAYETADGIFVYDVKNYPAVNRSIRLGDPPNGDYGVTQGPNWTLDGSRMMEFSGDKLLVWDMTGMMPSEPMVLATGMKPTDQSIPLWWSGDDKTVFLVQDDSLYALDASKPMAERHLITTSVVLHQPAPKGDGLIYDDSTGMNYVRVTAGVPEKPQLAEELSANWSWSPDGIHFGTEDLSMKLFDTSGPLFTMTDVYPLSLSYSVSPEFSFDGAYFTFNAGSGVDALMYGSVAAPKPVKPLRGMQPDSEGRSSTWHPSKPMIAYNVVQAPAFAASTEWVVSDVSGAEPSAPLTIPGDGTFYGWLGDGDKLLRLSTDHKQMQLVDMGAKPPTSTPLPVSTETIGQSATSRDQRVLALVADTALHLVDLANPSAAFVDVKPSVAGETTSYCIWSSDNHYLVFDADSADYQKRSVEIAGVGDGRQVSPTVTLVAPTTDKVEWSLQPVPK
jgi:hypothetical protein